MEEINRTPLNNRKGPDPIMRLIDLSGKILWSLLIFNLFVILSAKPNGETFFDRFFNIEVRDYWDIRLLRFALVFSVAQLLISVFSLYLNSKRLKRKDDRIRVSIIVSLFSSLIICIALTLITVL